jgi:hypothetical protein
MIGYPIRGEEHAEPEPWLSAEFGIPAPRLHEQQHRSQSGKESDDDIGEERESLGHHRHRPAPNVIRRSA